MGWTFLYIDDLPEPGELVWCKFPVRENPGNPGPVVRPTLVRQSSIHEDRKTGVQFGAVMVSYGTGNFDESHEGLDLIIKDWTRVKAVGLHKPTRFALDGGNTKNLIWCEEYFVPPDYTAGRGIHVGRLNTEEFEEAKACLERRKVRGK